MGLTVPKDGKIDAVGALGALPELEPILIKRFIGQHRREEGRLVRQEQAALMSIRRHEICARLSETTALDTAKRCSSPNVVHSGTPV